MQCLGQDFKNACPRETDHPNVRLDGSQPSPCSYEASVLFVIFPMTQHYDKEEGVKLSLGHNRGLTQQDGSILFHLQPPRNWNGMTPHNVAGKLLEVVNHPLRLNAE